MLNDQRTYSRILQIAAAYNVVWGALVVLFPLEWFALAGMEPPRYPELWQCIGMIVGVFGVGYWAASTDPVRHWPIVLTGLLGKILGPIGFLHAATTGALPWRAGWTIVTNDLIWWVPFALILAASYQSHLGVRRLASPEIQRMALRAKTQHGVSLAELSDLSPIMLVFLRHTGCTFCRQALADLAQQRREIEKSGTAVVLVHMSSEEKVAKILREKGLGEIHRVSDPGRTLYRAFGLDRGGLSQLFGPKVAWRGVAALASGSGIGRVDGDAFQMPGVFVLFRQHVISSYRHQSAADRPNYSQLARKPLTEVECIR